MAAKLTAAAKGVYVIATTPFSEDGAVDHDSIERLTRFYLESGVSGMTILGVMGEATKITQAEAGEVAKSYIEAVGGRVPIIVGVSGGGLDPMGRLAHDVMAAGAAGVMVQPPPGLRTDGAVINYMAGVVDALGPDVPICLQDYPQLTGTYYSADAVIEMVDRFETVVMFKHEEWPGLGKLAAIRAASDGQKHRRIAIFAGNGGMHLPQEYLRGADGTMTGFAFTDMLVEMDRLFQIGEPAAAEDLYDLYLPVMRHEFQIGIGLAIRKETLRRRGAIESAAVRRPGPKLSAEDIAELDRLLERLEAKTGRAIDQRMASST
jgi:4-hydroxy-tetrahydrodipicolinate synthase